MTGSNIVVRRMEFDYSPDMELVFIESDPDTSAVFLGTWFLLPYLEPYLMKTMRQALDQVTDPKLQREMKQFCSQEGQHYRQHAKANEVILAQCPDGKAKQALLEAIAEVKAEYLDFSENKSLAYNLAYAEGFEAYTCAGARIQLEQRMFDHMVDPIRDLMLWHIMEEVEHRAVAFDAYEHLVGKYFYRVRVGFQAQKHFISWGLKLAGLLKECLPEVFGRDYSSDEIKRRNKRNTRYVKAMIPSWLNTYSPFYSPHKVSLPAMYEEARQHYNNTAAKTA